MEVLPRQSMTTTIANQFTLTRLLVLGATVVLGLGMGFLIYRGDWFYALALALAAPVAILFITRPFAGVILWLLIMPFVSALPNPELMYWLFHRILIVATLALTVVHQLIWKKNRLPVRLRPPDVAVLILAGLIPILILAFQADIYSPLVRSADRILVPLFIYLIVRLNPLDQHDLDLLYWTVLFIVISQGIIGLTSIFARGLLPTALQPLRPGYASGSLDNPNVFATVLVFCGLLLYQSAMNRKSGWIRPLLLLACGLCVMAVFFSMERAVWLTGSLVLLGLLWVYPKPMIRVLLVGGFAILVLLQGGFFSKYISFASDRLNHEQPVYDRIVVSDAMAQMILMKPVLGWGYETLNSNITQYYRQIGDARIAYGLVTSHNTYLTILTEQGVFILLLYFTPAVWLLARTIRGRFWFPDSGLLSRSLLVVLWLAAMSYFVISNLMDMRFFPFGIALWWLNLGLIANLIYPYARPIKHRSSRRVRQDENDLPALDVKPSLESDLV